MAGKFVIKKGTTGKFRFNLLARTPRSWLPARPTAAEAKAMGGIRSGQSLASDAAIEDQTTKEWSAAEPARKAAS